jgi:hypothetical protein
MINPQLNFRNPIQPCMINPQLNFRNPIRPHVNNPQLNFRNPIRPHMSFTMRHETPLDACKNPVPARSKVRVRNPKVVVVLG